MTEPALTARLTTGERKALADMIRKGAARSVQALPGSATAHLLWLLWQTFETPLIAVTDGANRQDELFEDLTALANRREAELGFYPAWESTPSPDTLPHADITGDRLATLLRIARGNAPAITVVSVQALLQPTLPLDKLREATLSIQRDTDLELESLMEHLVATGYEVEPEVLNKGEAARRGGLVDVWPPTADWPLRIEWFGPTIDSIRAFDPNNQRSVEALDAMELPPATEWCGVPPGGPLHGSLLDAAPGGACWVWLDPDLIEHHAAVYEESQAESEHTVEDLSLNQVRRRLAQRRTGGQLFIGPDRPDLDTHLELAIEPVDGLSAATGAVFTPDAVQQARGDFLARLNAFLDQGTHVSLLFGTTGARDRFLEVYSHQRHLLDRLDTRIGRLSAGFHDRARRLLVVAESDLLGQRKALRGRYHLHARRKGPTRRSLGRRIAEWTELKPGDFVVHVEHGIGRYLGMSEVRVHGQMTEVLTLEYADKGRLQVPVTHAHLLSRYVGTGNRTPSLHRLGGRKWSREKKAAQRAVEDLAATMLETQAARDTEAGYAFAPDAPWQIEFDHAFLYEETPDQDQAIREVKQDMERPRPMDRLVCGDVGYGKTEVAMRAAFKAVMNGKQVAVLVPTTILAQQHRDSFVNRMSAFPFTIAMLSRFQTDGEQKRILRGVREGIVDIVIGTHRLLQADVHFKDLGLLVIDEEQRFGVAQKEHFKHLRRLVDVLTMTATPIPRTLYMSLLGAKDMSTIQTPPQERLPIETIVAPFDKALIRQAILRELNREGQVFFLHNRVLTIERMRHRIVNWVPEARVAMAHGQMHERELADVMRAFVQGEYDVLLCTTIIESGVDIPNVNTILIDRADRFGLSELYQLRGRVGRYKHKAYAYLLVPNQGGLAPDARERISALKRHTSLGSGFKLALKDLEIRGAGNLLGAEQSGHIAAVGFELYCQLLRRTVATAKGETPPILVDTQLRLDFLRHDTASAHQSDAAILPVEYIEDEALRVQAYRALAACVSEEEVAEMEAEFSDRYGPLPAPVIRLLKAATVRIFAARRGIESVETQEDKVILTRNGEYLKDGIRFPRMTKTDPDGKLDDLIGILRAT